MKKRGHKHGAAKRKSAEMLVLPKKKSTPAENLTNVLINDVTVMIGKQTYECHSCVLRIFCEVFAEIMSPGCCIRLPEEMISGDAFGLAYNWMMSPESKCERRDLLDLLLAAEYLCAPYLIQSVYEVLRDKRYFPKETALICFAEACTKGILNVPYLMIEHCGKCFLALLPGDVYSKLKIYEICCLLESNHIAVHTEVEVFYAALLWIVTDYPVRKFYIRHVLKHVRFEMMPSVALLSFGDTLNILQLYGVDLMYFLLNLAVICSQQRAIAPSQKRYRKYIRDPNCPYVKSVDEDRVAEVSAESFKDYIATLKNSYEDFESRIEELPSPAKP